MELDDENKVGEGCFGGIYKINKKDNKKVYAVKRLNIPNFMMDSLSKLSNETELSILK